jgi:hypothetical protein
MGRPSRAKPEVVDEICRRIASGESLRSVCADDHLPAISTVTLWIVDGTQPHFSEAYFKAREAAGYVHADRVQETGQELQHGTISPQVAKVALDAYKWTAERMAPKGHSPRTIQDNVSSDGSMSPQREISDEELDQRIRELTGGE